MPLTKRQRKERLGRGAQKEIADDLKVAYSLVSAVVNGKTQMYSKETVRKVREAAALRMGVTLEEAFGVSAAA